MDFKLLGDWRVPFMSSTWMKSLVYSVHQSSSLRTPVLETSCLKVTLLPMPVADTRTNSSLWVVIKSPKTYLKFDIGCEPSDHIDSEWACQELNRTRIGRHSGTTTVNFINYFNNMRRSLIFVQTDSSYIFFNMILQEDLTMRL